MKKVLAFFTMIFAAALFLATGNRAYAKTSAVASMQIDMTMLGNAHSRLLYDVYFGIPEGSDEVVDSITIKTLNKKTSNVTASSTGIKEITTSKKNDSLTIYLSNAITGGESVHIMFSYEAVLFSIYGKKVILDFTQALPSGVSVNNFTFRIKSSKNCTVHGYAGTSTVNNGNDGYNTVSVFNPKRNPSMRVIFSDKSAFSLMDASEAVPLRFRLTFEYATSIEALVLWVLIVLAAAGIPLLIAILVFKDPRKKKSEQPKEFFLKDILSAEGPASQAGDVASSSAENPDGKSEE